MVSGLPLPTDDGDHPGDEIRERTYPYDAHEERKREPILELGPLAVGYGEEENGMDGQDEAPEGLPPARLLVREAHDLPHWKKIIRVDRERLIGEDWKARVDVEL